MPCRFLESLPLEIRREIYSHALQSLTGFVVLRRPLVDINRGLIIVPFDPRLTLLYPHLRIRLFLLRANKQIHHESKNLLWQLNALYIQATDYVTDIMMMESLRYQLSHHIRHVEIDLGSFFLTGVGNTGRALRAFADWSRRGSLEKFTVIFPETIGKVFPHIRPGSSAHNSNPTYSSTYSMPRYFGKVMEYARVLEEAHDGIDEDVAGFAAHVDKKIIIDTGLDHATLLDKRMWLVQNVYRKNSFTSDLHAGFGGELWMDGELCYKDGVRMIDTPIAVTADL